ncbi:MAG TPA: DUF2064 domain-containing protein [Thermoanaerobaculia bacterium]|nr:DUF2064 domain-containing protein [Thermoanaerobaculia bacterium]
MSKPTLLVFTLGAARESARHRLLPERLRGMETGLRDGCFEVALKAGEACGCRIEVCSPSPIPVPEGVENVAQTGGDFGSRLAEAVGGALDRGVGPLLVVGSDVPGLTARHLARALSLLAEDPDRVVLGPSPDGGLYLLGTCRPLEGLGTAARWCRRDTLRGLLRTLRAAGRPVVLLEPLADLDRPADLERWLARRHGDERWRSVVGLLRRVLAGLRRPLAAPDADLRAAFATALAGRSPPSLVAS